MESKGFNLYHIHNHFFTPSLFVVLYQRAGEGLLLIMEEQYLNIRFSLLFNANLTSDEKLILAEMVSLNNLQNGCFASDNHFAKIINKSRQSVNGIIKKLERKGLISINVTKGIGKRTNLVHNFWELVVSPVEIETPIESIQELGVVEISDNTCRDSLDIGVENVETTCRETDTTNTSTITDLLLQEELQYTGASVDSTIENIDNQYQDACLKLIELITTDPAQITNPFVKQFQDCFAGLYLFFGHNFIDDCHIFKSNSELYEIYSSSKFYEVRQDLQFVRDNMDRFLRQQNWI